MVGGRNGCGSLLLGEITVRLLVQTDDIPARERFEFYREYVSHLPVPLDIRSKQPAAFSAKMSLVELGGLSVVSLSSQTAVPYEVRRTRSLIRRSDPEAYRLVLNVHGRSRLRHH